MAPESRLDMWTAAGKVQVTTSSRAATVPGTFMLGLFRNGDIRAYASRTEVRSDRCEHRAAGLSDAEPGLPPARSHLGRPPACRPPGHTWDGPLPRGPAALGNGLGASVIHVCRVSCASMGLSLCVSVWS